MKNSLLSTHQRAVLAGGLLMAGVASAQSTVTLYGVADMGFVRESGGAAGNVTKLTSGVSAGSRLGFRGREDLGGGSAAIFTLEMGIHMDSGTLGQGGLGFGRQAFVGLVSDFGTVTLGRQYTPAALVQVEMDPFTTGLAGTSANLLSPGGIGGNNRMDNAIKYATPASTSGWMGELVYGFGESATNSRINRQYGGAFGYASGPLAAKVALHDSADANGNSGKVTWLTAKYDFGPVTGYVNHVVHKGARVFGLLNADSRDWLVGLSAQAGTGRVMLSYIHKNDRTAADLDARQIALGYTYPLSKRTSLYASYARIDNQASNRATTGFYRVGNATEQGSGDRAFNFGMRHVF